MEPAKRVLRDRLRVMRGTRTAQARAEAADAVRDHLLALPSLVSARRVASYLALPTEPSLDSLNAALLKRGMEVLVPVVVDRADPDHVGLDWVALEPGAPTRPGRLGISEPEGARLGADALHDVDLVLAPATAVDHAGHRLGQGGGYYDRLLAGIRAPVCAVVFADELLPEVPHEPHDVPVQLVATEHGIFRVPAAS